MPWLTTSGDPPDPGDREGMLKWIAAECAEDIGKIEKALVKAKPETEIQQLLWTRRQEMIELYGEATGELEDSDENPNAG